nr:MAG TPA: tail tape measure [Caudoviricetes sp.]
MSTTVDSRVLEMRFDNKQFESGVATSMSTLEKLKQKLNLSGAAKGMEAIGAGVETVQAKFSALGVVGVTALANITNSAVNAGKRITAALTIDPIKTGLAEYETQINSVQTILANTESKGSTLQDVNRALDELNTYADKTIYNFTEMTRNIGTFTAAGVDLKTSVSSIKGIANLGAVSGSTSQQASTAMYQLSQALAAGKVQLMDWNSVVNAGMGGEVFQNALKRTAIHMGKDVDGLIKKYGSFRESLTQGNWLTNQVLTETLTQLSGAYSKADLIEQGYTEKQADDIAKLAKTAVDAATKVKTFSQLWDTLKEAAQSGWTQSWETIIGDFGEAKELLTSISDSVGAMIQSSADARNKVLSEGLSTGWKQMLDQGIFDEDTFKTTIKKVAEEHGIAVDEMIDKAGSFEKSLKEGWITGDILTESIDKMTKKMSKLSGEQLKEKGYTSEQIEGLEKLNESIKNGSLNMDDFAKKMAIASGRENMIEGLKNIFTSILDVIKPVKEAFRDIFPATTGDQLYAFTVKFKKFSETLKVSEGTANKIKTTFKGLFSVLDIGVELFKSVGSRGLKALTGLTGYSGDILDMASAFGEYLINLRESVIDGDVFENALDKISDLLQKGADKAKDFGNSIKNSFSNSDTAQGFVGMIQGLFGVLKSAGSSVVKAVQEISKVLTDMLGGGNLLDVINNGLFASILLSVHKFVKNLSDPFSKSDFLESVTDILDGVKESLESYQQNIKAGTLLKIAGAVGILAASLYVISGIDSDKIAECLFAVATSIGILVGAMALMNKLNDSDTKPLSGIVSSLADIARTIQMIGLAAAVAILAGSMRIICDLDWESLAKGMAGLAGMVTMLVAAAKVMNSEGKNITKFAGQMILMSAAIGAVAIAGKYLSSMSWGELAKGGVALVGVTALLVTAAKVMNDGYSSITKFGIQMVLMASAMAIMAPVLKSLGDMSWENIGKGLLAIAVSLTELAVGLKAMSGSLSGSAALLVAAGAIAVLAPTLERLGNMSLENIMKSLVAIAGAFVVIGVAGLALQPLIPVILGLAGAFALFGIAALGIGAGISLIAAGFVALSTSASVGATALVAALGVTITGILGLLPEIIEIISRVIIGVATVIGDSAPQLATSVLKLISGVLSSLAEYTPQIVDSLLTFFIGLINGVAEHASEIISAGANLIDSIISGIVEAFNNLNGANLLQGVEAVGLMTALVYALSGITALIPSAMAGLAGVGLLIGELSLILAALGGLSQIPGLEWLVEEGGDFLQKIGTSIGQFIGGIAGGIAEGATSTLPKIGTYLSDFMINLEPFISGSKSIDSSLTQGIEELSKAVLMITGTGFIAAMTDFITGSSTFGKFSSSIVKLANGMKEYSDIATGIDSAAITKSAVAAQALSSLQNSLSESGGLKQLLTGKQDLGKFGEKLVPFAKGLKEYSDAIQDVDATAILKSSVAASALVTLSNALQDTGGLKQLFTGKKDLSNFGKKLVPFAKGMKEYADAVSDIDSTKILASTIAAQALVSVANAIPPEGGFWSLVDGDKDLTSFGLKLVPFANAMKQYAESVSGIDASSILSSTNAAQALISVADAIPTTGGFWSLIDGDKDLGSFGCKLVSFAYGMKSYADSVNGINTDAIIQSASAASALVNVANALEPSGGLGSIIDGNKDLSNFGYKLVPFGTAMKLYAETVSGINASSIQTSVTAANALIEVANAIPPSGGFWSLINGDNDLGSFGYKLVSFAYGMKSYAESVSGIDADSINSSILSAKALISVAEAIPPSGGFWSLINGDNDLGDFGQKLIPFGYGMKSYAAAVSGIDTDSISKSGTAAQSLVALFNAIPETGGLWSLIDGDKNLSGFGDSLTPLGEGMKAYAESVEGLNIEAITASVAGAEAIIRIAEKVPEDKGLLGKLTGDVNLASFGEKLTPFGRGMKEYAEAVSGLNSDSITASVAGAQGFVDIAKTLNGNIFVAMSGENLAAIGAKMISLANAMKSYSTAVMDMSVSAITNSVPAVNALVTMINTISSTTVGDMNPFVSAINTLGKAQIADLSKTFGSAAIQMGSAAKSIMTAFSSGVKANQSQVNSSARTMIDGMATTMRSKTPMFHAIGATLMMKFVSGMRSQNSSISSSATGALSHAASRLRSYYGSFRSSGAFVASGFAAGIRSGIQAAANAAAQMASAASTAARKNLKVASPSKVFKKIGGYVSQGFAIGISNYASMVQRSVGKMTNTAVDTSNKAMTRILEAVNGSVDSQPSIRPVVDLSEAKTGIHALNAMLNTADQSIGVRADLSGISYNMNTRNQNGFNSDVVNAINKLRSDLGNMERNSYTINGITYDDGSNIAGAITQIVQAARIGGRA